MILNTQECKDFVKTNVIILKPKYFSSDALIAFRGYFVNDRCTTLREARNLYERELSQKRMENKLARAETYAKYAYQEASSARAAADAARYR